MNKSIAVLIAGVFILSAAYVSVSAQGTKSVKSGVYTEAQAKRGEALYKEQCGACHGDDLAGSGPMPALAGPDFLANWKNAGDLFEKIHSSMPANAPGSLSDQQTSDVMAYMFSKSNYPAGQTELEATQDALTQITIEKP